MISSNTLAAAAETFLARGLYGARRFHKHGWKLPIPHYEASDPLHARLSTLGKAAEQECTAIIANSDTHCLNKTVTQRKWLPQIGCYRTDRFT